MLDIVSMWARELLDSDALILDSETTGLGSDAEIIELAMIDMQGQVIFNSRLRPRLNTGHRGIDAGAAAVHGIRLEDLAGAPTLLDLYDDLVGVLARGQRVVIYNANFDQRMLVQSCTAWGLAAIPLAAECAMKQYRAYCWSKRWPRGLPGLKGGDHSAVGDCFAVLALLQQLAAKQ